MAFLQTYSRRGVSTVWAGKNLSEGRPDDVFITIEQNAERVGFRKGFSGDTASSLSSDHSLKVTLTFFPESQSAKFLTQFYNVASRSETFLRDYDLGSAFDTIQSQLRGLGFTSFAASTILLPAPLLIEDLSGAVVLDAPQAVLYNRTETSLGEDTGTVSFEFFVEEGFLSSDDNVIGNLLGAAGGAMQFATSVRGLGG